MLTSPVLPPFVLLPRVLAAVLLASVVAGCAVSNDRADFGLTGMAYHADITPAGNGAWQAAVETTLLRGRIGGARALATQDAVGKCQAENKAMRVIKDETDSHFLINGVARLTFVCE